MAEPSTDQEVVSQATEPTIAMGNSVEVPAARCARGKAHEGACDCEDASAARLGVYAAEINHLLNIGWEVRMRHDPKLGTLTAEIIHYAEGVVGKSSERFTVFEIPEDSIAAHGLRQSAKIAHLAGHPLRWEDPIKWDSVMHMGLYAAWRDWYVGRLPVNFPFQSRSEAA